MSAAIQEEECNQLIEALPRRDRNRILAGCEVVDLVAGDSLCERNQPLTHVYFPVVGFISLVTTLEGHRPLELSLIGNEGMLGVTLGLGIMTAPTEAIVQGAGKALRMGVQQFMSELRRSRALQRALNRHAYMLMVQLARTAGCTHFHEIEPRLARWLLVTHDRAQTDHFHLTHQLLADMLGVRRSGVTIAAGSLQKKQLVRYRRGEISVLDRRGLEAASCECYQALFDDRVKLFRV
ncbi:MAG TPA: Crp/Fnr family transcriptional regulator [Gammaproteobacteria bacterium]|nr:Crp/Fnr family transcriptional regulator [Gammaproteobacteria bacterium]